MEQIRLPYWFITISHSTLIESLYVNSCSNSCFNNALYFRDHVQWTEEEKQNARQKAEENSCVQIALNEQSKKYHLKYIPV